MDNQKFGEFIADCRKEQGLSQRQLADKLGVTDKAVSKWERGLGFPDIKTIEPLAEALGVSVLEIMQSEHIQEQIPAEDADAALGKVISEAVMQRKLGRRNLLIGVLVAFLLVALSYIVDEISLFLFIMVCLPYMFCAAGIVLIFISWRRARKKRPWKLMLTFGILLMLAPAWKMLFLGTLVVLGLGPVPS